jgi:4-carboxymuconolactone decarboxylase
MKNTLASLSLSCAAAMVGAAADSDAIAATVTVKRADSAQAVPGPDAYFTGKVRVSAPFESEGPGAASGATVSFDAGARTAWHTHPHGQILLVTAGVGLVQQDGQPALAIRPGDVVNIPPGARHWHGASPGTSMTHVAMAEKEAGTVVTWLDKVDDSAYAAAAAQAGLRAGAPAR